jgi:hypothetical protein
MKKLLTFALLLNFVFLFSQTLVTSCSIDLKKNKPFQQLLNVENPKTKEVFAFISDKENTTILKYNTALFLTDSLKMRRPNEIYKWIAGYTFEENGDPILYWSTADYKKGLAVQYQLNAKTISIFPYELPLQNEVILNTFYTNNTFYMLSQKVAEEKLVLHIFKNGKKDEKTLDFSSFHFYNKANEPLKLNEILEVFPMEQLETNQFNPLFLGAKKTKLYVEENNLILTFDYNSKQTQIFDINLSTFEITEKNLPQLTLKKQNGLANSYFHENKIYQLNVNDEEMIFSIKDYNSSNTITSYSVTKNDSITFKNSPLYLQSDNQKPQGLSNTKKFFQRLLVLNVGLSVYKTKKNILITLGGTNFGDQKLIDLSVSFNAALQGDYSNLAQDFANNLRPTNAYFECVFDKKLSPTSSLQEPLAIDYISGFMNDHKEVSLQNTFRYKDYYLFGYYDTKARQYVLRKFIDGFQY